MYGPHTIDRFASDDSTQRLHYNTKFYSKNASGLDAFMFNWGYDHNNYVFPPPALVGTALQYAYSRPYMNILLPPTGNPFLIDEVYLGYSLDILEYRTMDAQSRVQHLPKGHMETFPKLSKLFIKTSVLNSTTKHAISTTPAMRLVARNQGSNLSHGSFEDLRSILRQDRRQAARKDTLTKKGRESLQMTHNQFCETLGSSPDPMLLTVWEYRKSSTVNQYVNPWLKWVEYDKKAGSKPIPVNPFLFATWLTTTSLSETSLSDTTASPTETRCVTIDFFSKEALSTSPTTHQVVKMTRESIVRKLGFKKTSKNPLLKEHVHQIVRYFIQRHTIQDHVNDFRVTLAYEATLRWDDFVDTLLGDFIITHDFVRVFLVDTKTDNYKSGQWSTFSTSTTETSAYTLIQNLVKTIVANASEELLKNLTSFPIMFKSLNGSGHDYEIPKITYNELLKELKVACVGIGLHPTLFVTHSLRRATSQTNSQTVYQTK
jgi:hypothetical protein